MTTIDDLRKAAAHWDDLADAEERIGGPTGGYRANTYRDCAKSLRIQIETGVAVCSCCFKPLGAPPTFLRYAK